jgi:nitroreductase
MRRRRMVRAYLEQEVSDESLERILFAATSGPSAGNSRGVHWVVVRSQTTRSAIAELAQEPLWTAKGYPPWLSRAPLHLVLCLDRSSYTERYALPDKAKSLEWSTNFPAMDAGAAFMAVLLAAVSENLAAGFQGIHNLPGLETLLKIPDEIEVFGVVTIGHPDRSVALKGSPARVTREQLLHWETW